jgi:hypothetical protein
MGAVSSCMGERPAYNALFLYYALQKINLFMFNVKPETLPSIVPALTHALSSFDRNRRVNCCASTSLYAQSSFAMVLGIK